MYVYFTGELYQGDLLAKSYLAILTKQYESVNFEFTETISVRREKEETTPMATMDIQKIYTHTNT